MTKWPNVFIKSHPAHPEIIRLFHTSHLSSDASVRELAGVSRLGIIKKKRNK